jgi:hypothetical protein
MAVGRALPKARERVLLLTDSQVRQLRLSEMGRSETLTSRPSRPLGASGGIVSPLRRITLARCVAFHCSADSRTMTTGYSRTSPFVTGMTAFVPDGSDAVDGSSEFGRIKPT